MNLNDALASPMADIFNTSPSNWKLYRHALAVSLRHATAAASIGRLHRAKSTHGAKYWARVTKGLDFSDADRIDSAVYNRILWKGMMGNRPLSRRAHRTGPPPEPQGAPRELPAVPQAGSGAETEDRSRTERDEAGARGAGCLVFFNGPMTQWINEFIRSMAQSLESYLSPPTQPLPCGRHLPRGRT